MKTILLAGAAGKMGQAIQRLIVEHDDWQLSAVLLHHPSTQSAFPAETKIFYKLDEIQGDYDLWLDVTRPETVFQNASWAISHHIHPIIGTSGLTDDQIQTLQQAALKAKTGGIIAPNFSISAVLMMYFASLAAKFMSNVGIEEIHHPDKVDAPSGTAKMTAAILAQAGAATTKPDDSRLDDQSQSNLVDGIQIISKRQAGYVAYQSVNFANEYETLSIAQNSLDRKSFMPGVQLAIKNADQQTTLLVGLDKIMGLK
ncbi:MAG: 4-hydroxy-tetrahydrodipicolinate reductase [Oenococcus sp.]|uniref:4-hydroxy-tetrahydrodipicolinate reductase n=1 Tax=Oenococcus TaxID=46254 RepID=UPI0021E920BC|nr:4-hydroxy-tetrahydrodipicolinate reductase [Oenococcus kitaharae]MCV3295586.1 4-hydroxy-tetrahydrodipicolinate reductase [Oenococcus kitaharae]